MVAETFRIRGSLRSALLVDEDGHRHRFGRTVHSAGKLRYLAACGELVEPGGLRPREDFTSDHPKTCEACA